MEVEAELMELTPRRKTKKSATKDQTTSSSTADTSDEATPAASAASTSAGANPPPDAEATAAASAMGVTGSATAHSTPDTPTHTVTTDTDSDDDDTVPHPRVAIIEIGAGGNVTTVRSQSEQLLQKFGSGMTECKLIRINLDLPLADKETNNDKCVQWLRLHWGLVNVGSGRSVIVGWSDGLVEAHAKYIRTELTTSSNAYA